MRHQQNRFSQSLLHLPMHILLCAATVFEIEEAVQDVVQGKYGAHETDVLITGVGLTAAAYRLTKQITIRKPQLVIQAGIAGSLNKKAKIAEVVVVKSETIGDAGVIEKKEFQTLFQLKLVNEKDFPWKSGKLQNEHKTLMQECNLKMVTGVTVNEISTSKERIYFYRNKLKADIETLEGAALHYIALMEHVPFLQIRSISNYIGDRDKKNWKVGEAIGNLNIQLKQIISNLNAL
ncbi:MAG: futalosine hydrolase [Chitinophagaceae bacterium]|nr:futalosine hydrolase [Chitinophagaceae bacterium]